MLARLAAEADRKGWAGVNFTVKNDGQTTTVVSMEKVGPETARPKGANRPELNGGRGREGAGELHGDRRQ